MSLSFLGFWTAAFHNPTFIIIFILLVLVLFVNGGTDAPNAISGAVVTGVLSFSEAVFIASICNFFGVFCVVTINASVAETIYSIAHFGGGSHAALTALCAAMVAVVLWACLAWLFGIPTSEGHALIAGISGAAIALEGNISCIQTDCWRKVIFGLFLSSIFGFYAGKISSYLLQSIKLPDHTLLLLQVPGTVGTAFLHGAQDGQKFLGVFLLGITLAQGHMGEERIHTPFWLILMCAGFMSIGTLMGGKKIIDTVGREMVHIGPREGCAADVACISCLLLSTLMGIPVSTTHTRTAALLGVGHHPNWFIVGKIMLTWLLTFPGCMVIGYWMAKLFLSLLH